MPSETSIPPHPGQGPLSPPEIPAVLNLGFELIDSELTAFTGLSGRVVARSHNLHSATVAAFEVVLLSFMAGLVIAVFTTPVGVSGAVFLLPVQMTVLQVPNPAVTPTNLLFNIVAIPGALLRYRRTASLKSPLTTVLVAATVPGMGAGVLVRTFLIPGPRAFRLVAAALLLTLGIWLCIRNSGSDGHEAVRGDRPKTQTIALFALGVGFIGGIYGIGGGSLLSPILVGRGVPVRTVAPATLTSTLAASLVGAVAYSALAVLNPALNIAPNWTVGIFAGVGGLIGGYLGAALQPALPERTLRSALGVMAICTAIYYTLQAFR